MSGQVRSMTISKDRTLTLEEMLRCNKYIQRLASIYSFDTRAGDAMVADLILHLKQVKRVKELKEWRTDN